MTPQHIWTWPVILTMCISVLALAVAGGSLTWQIVSWRRSGPRVSLKTVSGVGGPPRGIQHLTTQGGNTLDDGSGKVVLKGGTVDGVTIGATTPAVSVDATTLIQDHAVTLTGTTKPWLNETGYYTGRVSTNAALNYLAVNDDVVVSDDSYLFGLHVVNNSSSPGIGLRNAIYGEVNILSAGTNTATSAAYVGVTGRATIQSSLGGTSETPIGSLFGGWFFGAGLAGTYLAGVCGVEIDIECPSGVTVADKIGLQIVNVAGDAVQGYREDCALCMGNQGGGQPWSYGIIFGKEQSQNFWPFNSASTMIRAADNHGTTIRANIGIDFSTVTFTGPAIKLPAAPIAMAPMASAPTSLSGEGMLYVASDGSLHYRGPTTDTQLAPA